MSPAGSEPDGKTELSEAICRHAPSDGQHVTAIPGLRLFRSSVTTGPVPSVFEPVLCVLSQGKKRLLAGSRVYAYTPDQFAIVTTDLPLAGQVTQASSKMPYLGLRLRLDFAELSSLIAESEPTRCSKPVTGVLIGRIAPMLGDCLLRLVRLLDHTQHIPVLFPLVQREILYLLLQSEVGASLREVAQAAAANRGILKAIQRIQRDYKKPVSMAALATFAQQSVSTFHRHFHRVTGLTPLQYQKRLRLQEARRLLLATTLNVSSAAYSVGYQSVHQFNREYHRLYGEAPAKDLKRLRLQELAET